MKKPLPLLNRCCGNRRENEKIPHLASLAFDFRHRRDVGSLECGQRFGGEGVFEMRIDLGEVYLKPQSEPVKCVRAAYGSPPAYRQVQSKFDVMSGRCFIETVQNGRWVFIFLKKNENKKAQKLFARLGGEKNEKD